MSAELLELTAAQAGEKVRAGEIKPAELFDFYRQRAAIVARNGYAASTIQGPS